MTTKRSSQILDFLIACGIACSIGAAILVYIFN